MTVGSLMWPSAVSTAAVAPGTSASWASLSRGMMAGGFGPTVPVKRGRAVSKSSAAIATRARMTMSSVTCRAIDTARIAVFTARPASSWLALRAAVTPRNAGVSPRDRSTSICAMRFTRCGRLYFPRCSCSKKRRMMTIADEYMRTTAWVSSRRSTVEPRLSAASPTERMRMRGEGFSRP